MFLLVGLGILVALSIVPAVLLWRSRLKSRTRRAFRNVDAAADQAIADMVTHVARHRPNSGPGGPWPPRGGFYDRFGS